MASKSCGKNSSKMTDMDINSNQTEASVTDKNKLEESQTSSSSASLSTSDVRKKLEDSDKSMENSNVNKEKPRNKSRTRVVQSRFRGGLSGSRNDSGNSRSGSDSNMHTTLVGSLASLNTTAKNKPAGGGPSRKPGMSKSVINVNKTSLSGRSNANLAVNIGIKPTKPYTASPGIQPSVIPRAKTKSGQSGRRKLHSTVLAERTMLGSTHNLFSNTLVGGFCPEGKKFGVPKKADVTCMTLPELPDISAITIDSASSNKSEDIAMLSSSSDKDSSHGQSGSVKEVSVEDLQREYLRFLQAAYLDTMGDSVFEKQIDELKTQVLFLEQLFHEKQQEVTERKKMVNLLQSHQNASEAYSQQMEQLYKLVESLPATENALSVLTAELEKNLHQVKMDNLYIPDNHKVYRDELLAALESQLGCLDDLQCLVRPRFNQLSNTINLLDDLQNNAQRIQQYEREVTQAAGLAIQEASLLFSATQTNKEE